MRIMVVVSLIIFLFCSNLPALENYLIIEGRVDEISAKSLKINKLYYPVSPFARVFDNNEKPLTLASFANIGFIEHAKVYLLGGKVEKIVVIEMHQ